MLKLDEAGGRPVTLSYSDVVDLEVLLGRLVARLERVAAPSVAGPGPGV
jgi:hypothetical protein